MSFYRVNLQENEMSRAKVIEALYRVQLQAMFPKGKSASIIEAKKLSGVANVVWGAHFNVIKMDTMMLERCDDTSYWLTETAYRAIKSELGRKSFIEKAAPEEPNEEPEVEPEVKPEVKTKLTVDHVKKIRTHRAAGSPLSALAEKYDCSPTCISNIVKRKTWKHVE